MILAGHYVCIAVAASARGCLLEAEISVEPSAIMTLGFILRIVQCAVRFSRFRNRTAICHGSAHCVFSVCVGFINFTW